MHWNKTLSRHVTSKKWVGLTFHFFLQQIFVWNYHLGTNLSNSCPHPTLKIKIRKSTNIGYMGTRIPTNFIFFYHLWHPQPRPLYLACQNFMAEIGSHFQKMKLRGCYLCMRLSACLHVCHWCRKQISSLKKIYVDSKKTMITLESLYIYSSINYKYIELCCFIYV